jgi:hypothetical protein
VGPPTDVDELDRLDPPAALRKVWSVASEIHQRPHGEHYDVFGFNLWPLPKDDVSSICIFGNEQLRTEWAERQTAAGARVSCANPSWRVIAAFSEFDFYFATLILLPTCMEEFGM